MKAQGQLKELALIVAQAIITNLGFGEPELAGLPPGEYIEETCEPPSRRVIKAVRAVPGGHGDHGRAPGWVPVSGPGDEAELAERGDAVVQADLLGDQAVWTFSTVVPVNRSVLPVLAGSDP